MPRAVPLTIFTIGLAVFVVPGARAKPDEATPAEVQHCRFIESVSVGSGYGKNAGWMPIAKSNAERKAGNLGATHIVWTEFRATGAFNGAVSARAYNCQR